MVSAAQATAYLPVFIRHVTGARGVLLDDVYVAVWQLHSEETGAATFMRPGDFKRAIRAAGYRMVGRPARITDVEWTDQIFEAEVAEFRASRKR